MFNAALRNVFRATFPTPVRGFLARSSIPNAKRFPFTPPPNNMFVPAALLCGTGGVTVAFVCSNPKQHDNSSNDQKAQVALSPHLDEKQAKVIHVWLQCTMRAKLKDKGAEESRIAAVEAAVGPLTWNGLVFSKHMSTTSTPPTDAAELGSWADGSQELDAEVAEHMGAEESWDQFQALLVGDLKYMMIHGRLTAHRLIEIMTNMPEARRPIGKVLVRLAVPRHDEQVEHYVNKLKDLGFDADWVSGQEPKPDHDKHQFMRLYR